MRKLIASLSCVAALASAAPSAAQDQDYELAAPPPNQHAGRLLLGIATVGNAFYCPYGYNLSNCSSLTNYSYAPLLFGAEVELGHKAFGFALGLRDLNGPYLDVNRNFFEPTADLVIRAGSYGAGSLLRFRIGAGMYVGEGGKTGWVGRSGIGFSIRGHSAFAFALDAIWEAGSFEGGNVSVLQFTGGPEISF